MFDSNQNTPNGFGFGSNANEGSGTFGSGTPRTGTEASGTSSTISLGAFTASGTTSGGLSHRNYQHQEHTVCCPVELQLAFNEAYIPFSKNLPIPVTALERLSQFTINAKEFIRLVTDSELQKSRYIYLESGKICFDENTHIPHGSIIMEIGRRISGQDDPFELFEAATGDGTYSYMWILMTCRCNIGQ
jgi:hypothetical protein